MRVLIVEDEIKIRGALEAGLQAAGYEVAAASTGEEGCFLVMAHGFDLVILDLMLPQRSGLEVLAALRARGVGTPVLILTAKDALEDRVAGLDAGADDYLVKPFAFPELLARMRALLRRGHPDDARRLRAADLEVDVLRREVTRAGMRLDLTAREYELLEYLLRHKNQLVSREMLARDVWKQTSRATPLDNVIDVHIMRLRKKVDGGASLKLIETVRGVGYIIRENAE
jgi:two-component system, OmpR family, copper resistance phosphate regulon response regulator CusR